jgi:carbonic anhydrase
VKKSEEKCDAGRKEKDKAIGLNAEHQAELLRTSSTVVKDALKVGKLKVGSGVDDLATGKVSLSQPIGRASLV